MTERYTFFDEEERKSIIKDFNEITENTNVQDISKEKLENALKGVYCNIDHIKSFSKEEMYENVMEIKKEGKYPIVHEDSLTAWANNAVENYGLEIEDIQKLNFGDKIDVIFMDRNVGDYTHGLNEGTIYDPLENGFSYGTYIHGENLSGILKFRDIDVVHAPFTWEINGEPYDGLFWMPTHVLSEKYKEKDLDKKTKIGWRGPAILVDDAKKYLPRQIKHYDTWWDDCLVFKRSNFLLKTDMIHK